MPSFNNKDPITKVLILKDIIQNTESKLWNLLNESEIASSKVKEVLIYLQNGSGYPMHKGEWIS
jgi:hypothetical protein